jgi:DNA-binding CsgD family transcriptional regulator/tetratricopeptide (TPR) repeat protein
VTTSLALDLDDSLIIGRDEELGLLARLVDRHRQDGAALLIEGAAGVGKSTLLEHATGLARAAGYRVLRCAGVQRSSPIGFLALHELLHPLLNLTGTLPPRQRTALLSAFAMTERDAAVSPDRLLISVAALGLVEEAASRGPLFLAVEDLHWIDRSSADVLAFIGARIERPPVVLLATARTEDGAPALAAAPHQRLLLPALDPDAAAGLLRRVAGDLSAASHTRILREAAGNPLALREIPLALREFGIQRTTLRSRLPTTRRLERAFLEQLVNLPAGARRLLLLAAVADTIQVHDLMAAARELGLGMADLAPLERAGLVAVSQDRLAFRHPLLRSALHGAASTQEWRSSHLALAAAVPDGSRSAWHRAAATFERDEVVAAELETVAARARRRGAQAEAAAAYQRAALLSPDRDRRASRLALAAETARAAGMSVEAMEILEEVEGLAREPETVARVAHTRTVLSLTAGLSSSPDEDLDALSSRLAGPGEETHRVKVLWGAAVNARGRNLPARDRDRIRAALQAIDTTSPLKPVGLAVLAEPGRSGQPLTGLRAELPGLRAELPGLVPRLLDFPLGLLSLAIAAESLQDLDTALTAWELSGQLSHESGAPADEAQSLRGRANLLLLRGRLTEGLADAEYAVRMALDTGQPLVAGMALATAARAHVLLGRGAEADAALARGRDLIGDGGPFVLVSADARWAAGLRALEEFRHRDALLEFTYLEVHPTRAAWAVADRVEAAVRSGRGPSVLDAVERAANAAQACDCDFLRMLVARSRALLDPGAGAEAQHEESLRAGELAASPLELARSRLAFGEWLRRERRIVQAREHLALALDAFAAAGARSFAERARAELRAAGEVPGPGRPAARPGATLTAQELQVARMAVSGLSNREIADRIYLSHRTVSTHLYKMFPKLGVTSRLQLRRALADAGYEVGD